MSFDLEEAGSAGMSAHGPCAHPATRHAMRSVLFPSSLPLHVTMSHHANQSTINISDPEYASIKTEYR